MNSSKHFRVRSWVRFSLRTAFIISLVVALLIGIFRSQIRNFVMGRNEVELHEQRTRDQLAAAYLEQGESIARALIESPDDAIALAGALALLQKSTSGSKPHVDGLVTVVQGLAQHDWHTYESESTKEMLAQLIIEIDTKGIVTVTTYKSCSCCQIFTTRLRAMYGRWIGKRNESSGSM